MAAETASAGKTEIAATATHSIKLLHSNGLPHGLGLLTTVASLPPKYRSRYLNISIKSEIPLDLSVKPMSPQIVSDVPIATSFTEVYTEPEETNDNDDNNNNNGDDTAAAAVNDDEGNAGRTSQMPEAVETLDAAQIPPVATEVVVVAAPTAPQVNKEKEKVSITPPLTPTKRKLKSVSDSGANIEPDVILERIIADTYVNPMKMAKTKDHPTTKRDHTPTKPIRATDSAPRTVKAQPASTKPAKNKATRKLKFDEETSSPVSGTIIRPLEDITDGSVQYSNGDIDPKYNIVEITEETKAELAAIKNVIGDYICKLCRLKFDDAFGLAQHRCACIVLLEYRCPECGKQFNCPANLASHRRWHKPKKDGSAKDAVAKKENRNTTNGATNVRQAYANELKARRDEPSAATAYNCDECGKKFKRQAYLRKHQLTHVSEARKGVQNAKTTAAPRATSLGHSYQAYGIGMASSSGASLSSSSSSSVHSYSGASVNHDDDVGAVYVVNNGVTTHRGGGGDGGVGGNNIIYEYDVDSLSECSNSSTGYGRLQIVESGLTEEENIAATALTNLRNCASVIQHTTLAH